MFAGHVGAALALKKGSPGVSLGWLLFAALFPDFLLGLLVLGGWEHFQAPGDFRERHYLTFDFPYSHGLLAAACWAGILALVWRLTRRNRAFSTRGCLVVAGAVISHWLLDWLVHVPELPVAGRHSTLLGLGLWRQMGFALGVETLIVAAGLWLCLSVLQIGTARRVVLVALAVFVTLLTVIGQACATVPPPRQSAALSWILSPLLLAGMGVWLERGTSVRERTKNASASDHL